MTERRRPQIAPRKQPQQARSTELVAAILQAAVQVLLREGAQRFTSARVAEKAGVSVGSVYQYFPNKAAILFRLQADEWTRTTAQLSAILEQPGTPPLVRLRQLVHGFIQSEFDEAQVRLALNDAAPLYREGAEAQEMARAWDAIMARFMREALPAAEDSQRALAGELILTTLATVGEQLSRQTRAPEAVTAYADAMADMFCAYLERC